MEYRLMLLPECLLEKQAVNDVLACNETIRKYELLISEKEAGELIEVRNHELRSTGRIEFGGGILSKLAVEFCDSPYVSQKEYTGILHELVEIFYYYKNELPERIGDDELIKLMKKYFDGCCEGSLELLRGRELEQFVKHLGNMDDYTDTAYYNGSNEVDGEWMENL